MVSHHPLPLIIPLETIQRQIRTYWINWRSRVAGGGLREERVVKKTPKGSYFKLSGLLAWAYRRYIRTWQLTQAVQLFAVFASAIPKSQSAFTNCTTSYCNFLLKCASMRPTERASGLEVCDNWLCATTFSGMNFSVGFALAWCVIVTLFLIISSFFMVKVSVNSKDDWWIWYCESYS